MDKGKKRVAPIPVPVTDPIPVVRPVDPISSNLPPGWELEDVNDPDLVDFMKKSPAERRAYWAKKMGLNAKRVREKDIQDAIDLYTSQGWVRDPNCERKDLIRQDCWETRYAAEQLGWVKTKAQRARPKAKRVLEAAKTRIRSKEFKKRAEEKRKWVNVAEYRRCRRGKKPDCR